MDIGIQTGSYYEYDKASISHKILISLRDSGPATRDELRERLGIFDVGQSLKRLAMRELIVEVPGTAEPDRRERCSKCGKMGTIQSKGPAYALGKGVAKRIELLEGKIESRGLRREKELERRLYPKRWPMLGEDLPGFPSREEAYRLYGLTPPTFDD